MDERLDGSFRNQVAAVVAILIAVAGGALLVFVRDPGIGWLLAIGLAVYLLRWFWRSTARKRSLLARGYFPGRRVGMHWVYDELREGIIVSIDLPLEYLGRGEYELHVPSESAWLAGKPDWARQRRAEIVERLGAVFKRSAMHFDVEA